ncbi:MAG TPA: DUF2933 domain-containing protein [Gaiellaceae bacterium]|nr:DUF2933 domain-containing protein [Gaiellaceae bacterium]
MRELLFLLLLLACPLAMLFMMRGGHAHGGHRHTAHASGGSDQPPSISELRQRRAELDRLIEERERVEAPVASEPTSLRATNDRERPAGVPSTR